MNSWAAALAVGIIHYSIARVVVTTVQVAPRSECFATSYNNGWIRNLRDGLGELSGTKLANQPDMLRSAPIRVLENIIIIIMD